MALVVASAGCNAILGNELHEGSGSAASGGDGTSDSSTTPLDGARLEASVPSAEGTDAAMGGGIDAIGVPTAISLGADAAIDSPGVESVNASEAEAVVSHAEGADATSGGDVDGAVPIAIDSGADGAGGPGDGDEGMDVAADAGGIDASFQDATASDSGVDAGLCGNHVTGPGEQCDDGVANVPVASAYGKKGACTTQCTLAPYCGDGTTNGPEVCDSGGSGSTALGACNPECSGYYTKKMIGQTTGAYTGNVGGPGGADAICQGQFGTGWKGLLVGGSRRATVIPYSGDSPQDWALQKYTYYYNAQNQLIWRTDDVALLGVSNGTQQPLNAPLFAAGSTYAWTGWNQDWTTSATSTCLGWTSSSGSAGGLFVTQDLTEAGDACDTQYFLLCAEQ
jgi:hypothetical protein